LAKLKLKLKLKINQNENHTVTHSQTDSWTTIERNASNCPKRRKEQISALYVCGLQTVKLILQEISS